MLEASHGWPLMAVREATVRGRRWWTIVVGMVIVLALSLSTSGPLRAQYADDQPVDRQTFYEELEPHGDWIRHARFGEVWVPHAAEDPSWRPYARGRWEMTDEYGWYWASDEPFGWAVYHYGRWYHDRREGWVWVPGYEWAPAWVAWRQGEDEVGWAPLPPEAAWDDDAGYVDFGRHHGSIYTAAWIFVPVAVVSAPFVYRHALPYARNSFFIGRSRHVTHYARRGRRIVNRGIDPGFVSRRGGRIATRSSVGLIRPPMGARRGPDARGAAIGRPDARRDWRAPRFNGRDGAGRDGRARVGPPTDAGPSGRAFLPPAGRDAGVRPLRPVPAPGSGPRGGPGREWGARDGVRRDLNGRRRGQPDQAAPRVVTPGAVTPGAVTPGAVTPRAAVRQPPNPRAAVRQPPNVVRAAPPPPIVRPPRVERSRPQTPAPARQVRQAPANRPAAAPPGDRRGRAAVRGNAAGVYKPQRERPERAGRRKKEEAAGG